MVTAVLRAADVIRSNLFNCRFVGDISGSGSDINNYCFGSSLGNNHHHYHYHHHHHKQLHHHHHHKAYT